MELIAKLIEVALKELSDLDVIDISDETVEFQAECEIECGLHVQTVQICDWYVFIHAWHGQLEAYYAIAVADCAA